MKKYKSVLDQHALFGTADIDGTLIEVNDKFCNISGFSRDELLDGTHYLMDSNTQDQAFFQELWETISAGKIWHGEVKKPKKEGGSYWVSQTIVPFLNAKKNRYEYTTLCTDISSQKSYQKELHDNWNFMEKVTSTMAQGVYVLNIKGKCTFWNAEAENILGWTKEELINQNLHQLIHYQDLKGHKIAEIDCPTLKSIENKQPYTSETEAFTHKEGHIVPISITAVPLLEHGYVIGSVAIFNDISARQENDQLLNQARIDAEQASQAKSDFLANMSHEIRTPMNGIIGMTDLALDTTLTDEQREYLEIVKESSCSLLSIINDILDFSKIDAGNLVLNNDGFNLQSLLDDILALSKVKATEKGLSLNQELSLLSELPPHLVGDSQRFRQILINLLDNAIKFTTEGDIKLTLMVQECTEKSCDLIFTVHDTGIGIEKNKHATIFDSFLQADSSVLRKFGGTGLGLSISKQLVELMGGEIWLESEVDKGSRFSFSITFQHGDDNLAIPLSSPALTGNQDAGSRSLLTNTRTQSPALMICNWDEVVKRLGDIEIIEIVVDMFFEEYHDYLNNINEALEAQDDTRLKAELHTLKGVCSAIGAERVEALIKRAEILLGEQALNDLPTVTTLITEIIQNIDELTAYFKEKFKK
jgi:PAS domain S-box-containing protein